MATVIWLIRTNVTMISLVAIFRHPEIDGIGWYWPNTNILWCKIFTIPTY